MRFFRDAPRVAVLLVVLASSTSATTIDVPGDFATIGEAITSAVSGDTVLVHPGTYTGPDNRGLDFEGKSVVLLAAGGADDTVIDCEDADRGVHFHTGEDPTAQLVGFTIRNGHAERGGAVYCESAAPSIEDCVFESNVADEAGGGLACADAEPVVTDCQFIWNAVTTSGFGFGGGGMHCLSCSPSITGCEFAENGATSGGGLYCIYSSAPNVTDCVFKENLASLYHGGGMFCYATSDPVVTDCMFVLNDAERNGGGIYCEHSSPRLTGCMFQGNEVLDPLNNFGGGAVSLVESAPEIEDCDFDGNYAFRGGGVCCRDGSCPSILDCRFIANTATAGAGIYCVEDSRPLVHGVFFESGVATSGGAIYADNGDPTVAGCVFVGNEATGTGTSHGGGAVHLFHASSTISDCAFVENLAWRGGAIHLRETASASLLNSTLSGNSGIEGSGVYCRTSSVTVGNSIISFGVGASIECLSPFGVGVSCTDVFGNSGGDWVGCISGFAGVSGNVSADPLFCGGGDIWEAYTLREDSPCTSGNSPCGQMGKWGVGCPATLVEEATWGSLKALYR